MLDTHYDKRSTLMKILKKLFGSHKEEETTETLKQRFGKNEAEVYSPKNPASSKKKRTW